MTARTAEAPSIGDIVEVESRHLGEAPRLGEILEVFGTNGSAHFRVRWEDGRETILYPGSDSHVLRTRRRATRR